MSGRPVKAGTTDVSTVIRIIDGTDGTPETGVTSASAGLDLEYRREGEASIKLTESDLSALTDAHSDGGILHIGAGYYRVDLPDDACDTVGGAEGVLVHGVCDNMVVIGTYHPLVSYDPYDGVRLGLTALPNAAADAAGGLVISDAGGQDIDTAIANIAAILVDTGTTLPATLSTISGLITTVDSVVDAILVDTAEIGAAGAGLTAITLGAMSAAALADFFEVDSGTTYGSAVAGSVVAEIADNAGGSALTEAGIADAVLDELLSGHTTAGSLGKAIADTETDVAAILVDTGATLPATLTTISGLITTVDSVVDAILVDTAEIGAAGAGLTAVPWNASWDPEVQSEVNDALVAIHLDHLLAVDYDPAAQPGVATALLNELIENDGGVSRFTANALEQGPSGTATVPSTLVATTIATLASQAEFTLTDGSTDDDAYNDCMVIVQDAATSTQKAIGHIDDYDGATKTVYLREDPAIFTMAAGDTITVVATAVSAIGAGAAETLTPSPSLTSIFNQALLRLGSTIITDPLGDEPNAETLRQVYASVRDEVLRAHPWKCALATAEIAADSAAPDFEYTTAYTLPADPYCLRVVKIYTTAQNRDWKRYGRKIHTNISAPLRITYIKRVTDETIFDADLANALSAKLAHAVAYKLTNSREAESRMLSAYRGIVSEARTVDSQEGMPDEIETGDEDDGSWTDT